MRAICPCCGVTIQAPFLHSTPAFVYYIRVSCPQCKRELQRSHSRLDTFLLFYTLFFFASIPAIYILFPSLAPVHRLIILGASVPFFGALAVIYYRAWKEGIRYVPA